MNFFKYPAVHVRIIRVNEEVSADSQCDSMWSELVLRGAEETDVFFCKDQETDWVFTEQTQSLKQLVQRGKKLLCSMILILNRQIVF